MKKDILDDLFIKDTDKFYIMDKTSKWNKLVEVLMEHREHIRDLNKYKWQTDILIKEISKLKMKEKENQVQEAQVTSSQEMKS